jgi:hypothetical protein
MKLSYFYIFDTWIICSIQFLLMVSGIVLGRYLAKNRSEAYAENPGNTAVVSSLYGLMGLQVAFTFAMSADRFKERKQTIVEESNCISTAILRIQLYADSVQPEFNKHFREYLEARIRYYEAGRDTGKIREALQSADLHGRRIWAVAATQSRIPTNLVASNQMVPALNAMIDITNTRFWGEYDRTPPSILTMLFLLAISASFMIGYTSADKGVLDWTRAIFFCFFTTLVLYFIIDLDRPRAGSVRLDSHRRAITDLRGLLH